MRFKNFGWVLALLICTSYAPASNLFNLPPGSIMPTARTSCPTGTVAADGSSLARSGTYGALFSAISTTYGAVDGSHFSVPNLQGIFPKGAGSQTFSGITYSGSLGTYEPDAFQGHLFTLTDPGHSHSLTQPNIISSTTAGPGSVTAGTVGSNISLGVNTSATGISIHGPSSDGTNGTPRLGTQTHPASVGVLYCIWY